MAVTVSHDGRVLDLAHERRNAVACSMNKVFHAGLELARDDEPGFRVKWNGCARKDAWENAGFDVAHTPTGFIVSPKGVDHE